MKTRNLVLSFLTFVLAAILLCNFGFMWQYGECRFYESNAFILGMETFGIIVIIAFSIYCFTANLAKEKEQTDDLIQQLEKAVEEKPKFNFQNYRGWYN